MIFIDHAKIFNEVLFNIYPREAGFPSRQLVNSFDEFLNLAQLYHLSSPVFIQLYNVNKEMDEVVIDKLWIDFDGKNQYELMSDLKTVYSRMLELGITPKSIIPAWTGGKGFHIYAVLKPKTYSIKEAKNYLKWIISWLCRDLKTPDSPLFADINRMVRFSGIQRPKGTFMLVFRPNTIITFPTINDFFVKHKFAWKKLIHIGSTYMQHVERSALSLPVMKTFIEKKKNFKPPRNHSTNSVGKTSAISPITKTTAKQGEYFEFLKLVILDQPLFYAIHAPNPRHIDRVRFAIRLFRLKITLDHAHDIVKSLRWIDYEEGTTLYQLNYIKDKYNL